MEGRCESNRGGDEVYPATFGNEEKTGLKLDRRNLVDISMILKNADNFGSIYFNKLHLFMLLTTVTFNDKEFTLKKCTTKVQSHWLKRPNVKEFFICFIVTSSCNICDVII